MGDHGHLRVRRSRSFEHSTRSAFSIEFTEGRRLMGRTGNHGHRISGRLLSKVRHVPSKLSASRSRELCELPQRLHHPAGVLSGVAQLTSGQDSRSSRRLTIDRQSARPNVFVWLTNYRNYLTTTTRSSRTSMREQWRSITPSIIRLTSPT